YALRKLAVDPSPMVVALVLGPMMEKTLRQALFLTRGSVLDLVARPLSATILVLAAAALFGPMLLRLVRGARVPVPRSARSPAPRDRAAASAPRLLPRPAVAAARASRN